MSTNFVTEDQTTITATSENPNFPVSNLKNPLRSKRWRTTGIDDEAVIFDMQTAEDIDSVVLLWPKEDGIRLTNSVTITIQANATNVWTSPAVTQTLTVDNTYSIASHYFSSSQSYRYWRLLIDDPTNPDGFIELGMIWLGQGLEIDNAQNGFKYSIMDTSKISENAFNHKYVDEYPQVALLELKYSYFDYDAIRILENAYRINGSRKPVLVVVDPLASVFNKDHITVYGLMTNKLNLNHRFYNVFDPTGVSIEELS